MNAIAAGRDGALALSIAGLSIGYDRREGRTAAVTDVSFSVARGEIFGLVGETGCGKSTVLRAIIGLLHPNATITAGSIAVAGADVTRASARALEALRRRHVAMIFQDPLRALNPVLTIGEQLSEGLPALGGMMRRDVRERVVAAIIRSPELLLADEPTTALDVTIQDQILALLRQLCRDLGMSVILVTHDIGVVAETCDRVGVMYAGRLVEIGSVMSVLGSPSHPYTAALLASIPRIGARRPRLEAIAGLPPDLNEPIRGCAFAPRCRLRVDACGEWPARLEVHAPDQLSACLRHAEPTSARFEVVS